MQTGPEPSVENRCFERSITLRTVPPFAGRDATLAMRMLSAVTQRLRRTDERQRRRIARIANEEDARKRTFAERAADRSARCGGSWEFIIFSLVSLMLWMAANGLLLRERP